ncbi:MAG: Trp biosynthesis-associated membrane protein [Actinomycetes bacterium]
MSRIASRRVAIALLVAAALAGIASGTDAGTGIAVLALATVPALFAVPPRARRWLGAAVTGLGIGAGALGDLNGDLWARCSIGALVAAGILIGLGGRTWPALSGRYGSSRGTATGSGLVDDPTELWRELDRGHDPTVEPRDTAAGLTPPDDTTVD